jgi:hypothetical protein
MQRWLGRIKESLNHAQNLHFLHPDDGVFAVNAIEKAKSRIEEFGRVPAMHRM